MEETGLNLLTQSFELASRMLAPGSARVPLQRWVMHHLLMTVLDTHVDDLLESTLFQEICFLFLFVYLFPPCQKSIETVFTVMKDLKEN